MTMNLAKRAECGFLLRTVAPDLLVGLLLAGVLALLLQQLTSLPAAVIGQTLAVFTSMAVLICLGLSRTRKSRDIHGFSGDLSRDTQGLSRDTQGFGAANRVTLVRGVIAALFAGLVFHMQALSPGQAWVLVVLATIGLVLDGVDGWVARRTGASSEFGARFDMELDAFFILVLCVLVLELGKTGPWVLLIGLLRYLFVAAAWWLPALRSDLPESLRRKTVCVVQSIVLVAGLAPVISPGLASLTLAIALFLLVYSFTVDSLWLLRRKQPPEENHAQDRF